MIDSCRDVVAESDRSGFRVEDFVAWCEFRAFPLLVPQGDKRVDDRVGVSQAPTPHTWRPAPNTRATPMNVAGSSGVRRTAILPDPA